MSDEYRKGVGAVLINKDGKIFAGKTFKDAIESVEGTMQMIQGGIEEGEHIEQTLQREINEEAGLNQNDVKIIDKFTNLTYYTFPEDLKKIWWNGKYAGQCHEWFLCYVKDDSLINIFHNKSPEFEAYKWLSIDELLIVAPQYKYEVYKKVLEYFKEKILSNQYL